MIYNILTKRVVAEYTGRPVKAQDYYEGVRKLLLFYNATDMYENMLKGLFVYFESRGCTFLLADRPSVLDDVLQDSKVNRKKGFHADEKITQYGNGLIKAWLLEPHSEDDPEVLNLHRLRSIPLIQELIAWDPEGNYDRVDALRGVMLYLAELRKFYHDTAGSKDKETPIFKQAFFERPLFVKSHTPQIKFN
jgi:hypothetical protein